MFHTSHFQMSLDLHNFVVHLILRQKSILKLLKFLITYLFDVPCIVDSVDVFHIWDCCIFKHLHILLPANSFPLSVGLVVFLCLDESFTIPAATFLLCDVFLISKLFVVRHALISSFLPSAH